MKSLSIYLIEGLKNDVKKWLQNVYQSQQSLIKDNKVTPLQVDINNLNKPKRAFTFDDFTTDPIIKKLIGDRKTGFVVTNQMIRNPKQYILDEDKELTIECMPYWYQDGNNIYFVNLCLYDKTAPYVDGFVNIFSIESSLAVEDSEELNKAILSDFIKFIETEGTFSGISTKPKHPKMKAILIKLGFNPLEDDKEIFTYKI